MKTFINTCIRFFKKETVLCIAGFLAFISAFFVHPSAAYMGYIDFRVLSLLFSLMLVVAGFQSIGLFSLPRLCTSYKSTYHKAINTGAFPVMLFFQHVHHQ